MVLSITGNRAGAKGWWFPTFQAKGGLEILRGGRRSRKLARNTGASGPDGAREEAIPDQASSLFAVKRHASLVHSTGRNRPDRAQHSSD